MMKKRKMIQLQSGIKSQAFFPKEAEKEDWPLYSGNGLFLSIGAQRIEGASLPWCYTRALEVGYTDVKQEREESIVFGN